MRQLFLCGSGPWMLRLTEQLFECASEEIEGVLKSQFFSSMKLTPILLNALEDAGTIFSFQVDFRVLEEKNEDKSEFLNLQNPKVFDSLRLEINSIEWPCNLIVTESILARMQKIFQFFMSLHFTLWALRDVRHRLNYLKNFGKTRKIFAFAHAMQHFVGMLLSYFASQVVEVGWAEFFNDFQRSATIDQMHQALGKFAERSIVRYELKFFQNSFF